MDQQMKSFSFELGSLLMDQCSTLITPMCPLCGSLSQMPGSPSREVTTEFKVAFDGSLISGFQFMFVPLAFTHCNFSDYFHVEGEIYKSLPIFTR